VTGGRCWPQRGRAGRSGTPVVDRWCTGSGHAPAQRRRAIRCRGRRGAAVDRAGRACPTWARDPARRPHAVTVLAGAAYLFEHDRARRARRHDRRRRALDRSAWPRSVTGRETRTCRSSKRCTTSRGSTTRATSAARRGVGDQRVVAAVALENASGSPATRPPDGIARLASQLEIAIVADAVRVTEVGPARSPPRLSAGSPGWQVIRPRACRRAA
jgi:hypothetical protein